MFEQIARDICRHMQETRSRLAEMPECSDLLTDFELLQRDRDFEMLAAVAEGRMDAFKVPGEAWGRMQTKAHQFTSHMEERQAGLARKIMRHAASRN